MSNNDAFDRQFRRTARGMRRRPAPVSWDRIESRLDRRGGGTRFLGMRPWLIAAVVILVAGFAALGIVERETRYDPLAQRAESVEELNAVFVSYSRIPDYTPLTGRDGNGTLVSPGESRTRLTPAPKYRL